MVGTSHRIAFISIVALLLTSLSGLAFADHHEAPAAAPAPEWDQEKVAGFAQQLADAVGEIHREIARQNTASQVGSGHAQAMLQFRQNIRVARESSRSLARSLGEGETREETTSTYRRLMTLVRDARETAKRLFIPEPSLTYIGNANAALDGLAPFYPDIRSR